MFNSPVKSKDSPVIYTSTPVKRIQLKDKNCVSLVSGSKIKMVNRLQIEEEIILFITNSSEKWFGKKFSYEKIKSSLRSEMNIHKDSVCVSALYNREIDISEIYRYTGSKISFQYTIDKLEIKGKDIVLFCTIDVAKFYKKDSLDSKYLIQDDEDDNIKNDSSCEYSEVSDDEVDIEYNPTEDETEHFFV